MAADAARKGVAGVPFTVIDGRWAVSGCQKPECFYKVRPSITPLMCRPTRFAIDIRKACVLGRLPEYLSAVHQIQRNTEYVHGRHLPCGALIVLASDEYLFLALATRSHHSFRSEVDFLLPSCTYCFLSGDCCSIFFSFSAIFSCLCSAFPFRE